jgi:molybdate transport system substrate-binding protein
VKTRLAVLLLLIGAPTTTTEELKILSAVGMRQVIIELGTKFEQETGHKLTIAFDSGAMVVRRIESGEGADVVLVPQGAARDLVSRGRAVTNSVAEIASSRVGVAVRAGAPRPDIASTAAFRQTLLLAKSIARPDPQLGGSSGVHIASVLERLGIAEIVASRTVLSSRPDREEEMPGVRVASGRAEIALHQIQELIAVPGLEVVGPFPEELDGTFMFSAALVTGTVQAEAGRAFIGFLRTPESRAAIKSKGMEPAARR